MERIVRAASVLAFALLSFVLVGCVPRFPGGDDVELTYDSDAPPAAAASFGEDLRALVLRRLSAGHVGADVVEDGRRIHVVVDEALAPVVDDLLTWTGALQLFEVDAQDGEPVAEGTRAEVKRAFDRVKPGDGRRVLAEPIWDDAHGGAEPRYRTRIVRAAPLGELAEGGTVGWGEGGTLRIRTKPGSPAAAALAQAQTRDVVLARGTTSLGKPKFDADGAVVSFGTGFEAYARAQQQMQLLTTPRLPPLRRAGALGLPPNTALATACIVVPLVLSLAWLVFIRRFDRAHPEPMWLVLVTFALGGVATVPAALAEYGLSRASPWLDPRLVTFGGRAFALPLAIAVFTVVVGLVEEGAKLAAATFAARRKEFDEPIDGIVYGIVASLGFAAAENVQFFASGRLAAPLVVARCFMSIPAHMFFGAIWGYALGARLVDPRRRLGMWLLLAAAMHGLFDALLSTDGANVLAVFLNVALSSTFVALVRRALRHGIVEEAARAIRPEQRMLFRVGRPRLFLFSAAAVHVLAFGIFMLGAWYQLARHRPSLLFVGGSTVLVLLLGIAAFGVSAALPLDVVVDPYGVTFAGAARPWRIIRGFRHDGDHIALDCEGGALLLGPAPAGVLAALSAALRRHRERLAEGDGDERSS